MYIPGPPMCTYTRTERCKLYHKYLSQFSITVRLVGDFKLKVHGTEFVFDSPHVDHLTKFYKGLVWEEWFNRYPTVERVFYIDLWCGVAVGMFYLYLRVTEREIYVIM